MLKAQNRGRREHRNLLAVLHRFEGRAHGHFGLAIANVSAQQPIHRRGRFHVVLDGTDRRILIVGLAVIERILKFLLKFIVFRERSSLRGGTLGV